MKLIWLDIETTGLDPNKDVILEIAVAEADLERPFELRHIYEAVLAFPHPSVSPGWKHPPAVLEMHIKNGLWDACHALWGHNMLPGANGVELALLDLIPWVEDYSERPTLAGSSVHFDHAFLSVHMPELAKRFSHRHYDVSAIKLFARSMGMIKIPKAEAHRAKADIIESAAHAKLVAEWFATLTGVADLGDW